MKVFAALLVLLLAVPSLALAQGGINLSWDDCGTFGNEVRFFACDTNAGASVLYVSAIAPVPMPQLNGVEVVIDLFVSQPTISDWWQFASTGCHALALSGQFNFTAGPFNCLDIWAGAAAGGINYAAGFGSPNRARLRGVAAIPSSVATDDQTEMYLFAFRIDHSKSAGQGSCAGCTDKACIVLNSVQLTQPLGVGNYTLSYAINRQWTFWRCPGVFNSEGQVGCSYFCSTPTKPSSWGAVKSLYR